MDNTKNTKYIRALCDKLGALCGKTTYIHDIFSKR